MRESHKTETRMQSEHLWQKFNDSAMAGLNFEGAYQRPGFNPPFLSGFELGQENSMFSLHANEPTDVGNQPETVHVKKELQEKIKAKHKENGTELPRTEMKEPDPPKPKLKDEDPETIKKRRERNKIAAMKCRKRKRERIMKLEKRANEIRAQIRLAQAEKNELHEECERLTTILNSHRCCKKQSTSHLQPIPSATTTCLSPDPMLLSLLTQTLGTMQP